MTDVAFHFNVEQTLPYACRLLRKAVAAGSRVLVVGDRQVLQALDRDLWTFSALEFVAHCRGGASPEMVAASPIVLVESANNPRVTEVHAQVLLNLGSAVPEGFDRFPRLIEIVSYDDADRAAARQRWRHYADAGLSLIRHDLSIAR